MTAKCEWCGFEGEVECKDARACAQRMCEQVADPSKKLRQELAEARAALRSVAERQREACALALTCSMEGCRCKSFTQEKIRATPLVTEEKV